MLDPQRSSIHPNGSMLDLQKSSIDLGEPRRVPNGTSLNPHESSLNPPWSSLDLEKYTLHFCTRSPKLRINERNLG